MRRLAFLAIVLLIPLGAEAGVKLVERPDGTKAIVNDGRPVRGGAGLRESTLQWLANQRNRTSRFDDIIERHAEFYRVDPVLVRAVIQVESNFDPRCVSHKGARGLMQLMPATAKRFNVTDIHDPDQNIRGGIAFLAHLQALHAGNLQLILASYNAGEGAVSRYGGIPPYRETREYVQKALTVYHGRVWGAPGAVTIRPASGRSKLEGGFTNPEPKLPPYVGVASVSALSRPGSR